MDVEDGTEVELRALLRLVREADERGDPADNEALADAMDCDLSHVAALLGHAKRRSLIWGQGGGRKPGPWFSELELTVQGQRFLRNAS